MFVLDPHISVFLGDEFVFMRAGGTPEKRQIDFPQNLGGFGRADGRRDHGALWKHEERNERRVFLYCSSNVDSK